MSAPSAQGGMQMPNWGSQNQQYGGFAQNQTYGGPKPAQAGPTGGAQGYAQGPNVNTWTGQMSPQQPGQNSLGIMNSTGLPWYLTPTTPKHFDQSLRPVDNHYWDERHAQEALQGPSARVNGVRDPATLNSRAIDQPPTIIGDPRNKMGNYMGGTVSGSPGVRSYGNGYGILRPGRS